MIRGGSRTGRIARLLACTFAALAIAPAAAMAQSAVDEYTLDIPGGGGGGDTANPGGSAGAGAAAAGTEGTSRGTSSTMGSGGGGGEGSASDTSGAGAQGEELSLNPFHDGSGGTSENISANAPLDTSSRSAPEVVADTLFDGATLPILAALVLITAVGVWRVLRQRGTLSGQAG
jgi:hypothetical protein